MKQKPNPILVTTKHLEKFKITNPFKHPETFQLFFRRKINSMSWFSNETLFFFSFPFFFLLFLHSNPHICGGFVFPLRFLKLWWYILPLISRDLWWFVIVSLPIFTNLRLLILFCWILCFMMWIFDKKSFYCMESVAKA